MAENLELWNRLGRTDPNQTKAFTRGGGFRGTAIKPIYTEQKMTEIFGACGVGWGFTEPRFEIIAGADDERLVYCWLSLWFVRDGARSEPVFGVGGDKIIAKFSSGLKSDDEAFKKAFTDALGNAMKHLGMSADVHMGRFDDSKYVSELKAEIEDAAPVNPNAKPKAKSREAYEALQQEIDACESVADLKGLWASKAFQNEYGTQPGDWQQHLIDRFNARIADLTPKQTVPGYTPPNFDHIEPEAVE